MTPATLFVFLAASHPSAAPGFESAPGVEAAAPPGPIRRVERRESAIALTFDACAIRTQGYGFDRAVFEVLKRERVPATIFVSGRWVESHPDAMVELAREPLIEFGDHSYDHPAHGAPRGRAASRRRSIRPRRRSPATASAASRFVRRSGSGAGA